VLPRRPRGAPSSAPRTHARRFTPLRYHFLTNDSLIRTQRPVLMQTSPPLCSPTATSSASRADMYTPEEVVGTCLVTPASALQKAVAARNATVLDQPSACAPRSPRSAASPSRRPRSARAAARAAGRSPRPGGGGAAALAQGVEAPHDARRALLRAARRRLYATWSCASPRRRRPSWACARTGYAGPKERASGRAQGQGRRCEAARRRWLQDGPRVGEDLAAAAAAAGRRASGGRQGGGGSARRRCPPAPADPFSTAMELGARPSRPSAGRLGLSTLARGLHHLPQPRDGRRGRADDPRRP